MEKYISKFKNKIKETNKKSFLIRGDPRPIIFQFLHFNLSFRFLIFNFLFL